MPPLSLNGFICQVVERSSAPITLKQELRLEGPTVGTLVWVGLDFVTHRPMSLPYAGICLAYFTSGFNTAAVDHEADGSTNNGIFQISSRRWCKNFTPNVPNQCQMYCSGRLGLSLGLAGGRLLHPPLRLYGFFFSFCSSCLYP